MKKWQIKLLITVVLLAIGIGIGRWTKKSTENIITIGGKPFSIVMRDMLKPKFPFIIVIRKSPTQIDSFTIYADTPIGEIPVIRETRCFPVPVFVNDKDESYEGDLSVWVQGIMDSIVVNVPVKRITVKESIKGWFNWHAGLNVWIDQAKHLSADITGSLEYKRRFGLKAKIEAESNYDVKLKLGISVGI